MSYDNPTTLRLGAQGVFDGRQFTVRGRVVLGMELDGETYYWNEFNLVDDSGGAVTLVHEETENGYVWKLFRLFEPLRPLSVGEAAAKRAGDTVDFEGHPIHVSLVDQSRVYHIEGVAPEGVEVGDVADYFNADAGDRTLVASWTGEEIEFYEGRDLPAGRVEAAFNLPAGGSATADFTSGEGFNHSSGSGLNMTLLAGGAVALVALVIGIVSFRPDKPSTYQLESPARPAAPARPAVRLLENARGTLAGRTYAIAGHALVGIARQGGKFDRDEYDLVDDTGSHVLLVNGLGGNAREWHLFAPVEPPEGFTPYEAAALRQGKLATIAGRAMQVTQLFQSRVLATDGRPAAAVWPVRLQYGLLARVNDDWLISRWSETGIQLYDGKALAEQEVLAALGPVDAKPK